MGWRIIAALASACALTLARCRATSSRQLVQSLRQKILGATTLLIAEATAATFRGRRDPHHRRASGRAYARPQSTQDQPLISSVNTSGALNLTGLPSLRLRRDGGLPGAFAHSSSACTRSATVTSSTRANSYSVITVGFRRPRSRLLKYCWLTPERASTSSCVRPLALRSREKFCPTNRRISMRHALPAYTT